jgi:CRISPR-associated protein Cmr2
MASVHWLKEVMIKAKIDDSVKQCLATFDSRAFQLTHDRGGWENKIKCIGKLIDSRERKNSASHDGNVFFPFILENKKLYSNQEQAKKVIRDFSKLKKIAEIGEVSPFYAVLMMDGDSLGKQMSVLDNQAKISNALGQFTKQVETTVDLHNGFLIYAGGDDVLAILPLEDALNCAKALRDDYTNSFNGSGIPTTLSGAIEYVHIKTPLTKVLRDAHDLLDNIAKEKTGRDALAIRIWKAGGLAVQWSQPWEIALSKPAHHQQNQPIVVLQSLIEIFQNHSKDDPQFSSKFFYKIRERFELLNPPTKKAEGETNKAILTSDQAITLMAMEYINSSKNRNKTMQEAKEDITLLLEQCRPNYYRIDEDSKEKQIGMSDYLQADGALLVRFLAHKGVE